MRIFSKSVLLSILILLISVAFYFVFINSKPEAHSKKNPIEVPLVETFPLESKYYSSAIKSFGEIITTKEIDIKYPESGKIFEVGNISSGSSIKKGDLLFRVDAFEIENDIKQNEAEKNVINSKIGKLKKQIFSKNLYMKEVENQKKILSKQLKNKLSIASNVISENSLDELRLSLSRLDESLINIREIIDVLHIDLETNKIELNKLDIVFSRYQNDLNKTYVRAPFSGHIENIKMYAGQEIFKNEILGKLKDTKNLEVKFFIGGEDYNNLLKFHNRGIGKSIEVKWLVGKKEYVSEAIITRLDGEINNDTDGLNLYAKLVKNNNIPIGAFVEINMKRILKYKTIKIPNSAVFNNKYIYLLEGKYLNKKKINVVSEESDGLLIKDNDLDGKFIVVTRLSEMQNNMQVQSLDRSY